MRKNRLVSIMLFLAIALSSLAGVGSSIAIEGKAKGIKDIDLDLRNSEMSFLNDMMIRNAISVDIKPDDLQKIGLGRFSIEDVFKFIPYLNKDIKDNLSKIKISNLISRLRDLPLSLPSSENRKIALFEGKRNFSRLIIKVKNPHAKIDIKGYIGDVLTSFSTLSAISSEKITNFTVTSFGSSNFGKVFVVSLPSSINLYSIIDLLKDNPNVEYVEPDYQFRLLSYPVYPNDPMFSEQWYLNSSSDHDIDAPEAWHTTTGSDNIIVAIVDSGIDYAHEDLSANVWVNSGETPDNGIDDDHNGYIDDVMGWNFVLDNNNVTDNLGHGTWCAGMVGAIGNNSKGIAGLNWHCKIMPVKCFDYLPVSFASILAKGIIYAADNGADVISLSWGAPVDSKLIRDAISYAETKGTIVVAAAGNFGNRLKIYPAAYPSVIAVAATDSNDEITSFSNWGEWIDISAPGEDIVSTWTNGEYNNESGTSASAPLVAGTIALMLSEKPDATRDEILTALKSGAEPVTTYGYRYIGVGRFNVNNSLDRLTGIVTSLDRDISGAIVSGVIDIRGSAFGPEFSTYHLYYGKGVYPATWHEFYSSSSQVVNGVLASWNTMNVDDGLYTIKLEVIDNHSKVYTDMIILTVNNVQNVWYVGGYGPSNFTSIQDAILESGDEDTIFLYNGSYSENLIIVDRSISIVGEDRNNASIYSTYPLYIKAENVKLKNLSIKSAATDIILDSAEGFEILGCKSKADILIANSTGVRIDGNIFESKSGVIISIPIDLERTGQEIYDLNVSSTWHSFAWSPHDTDIVIVNNTNIGVISLICSNNNKIKNNTMTGIILISSSQNIIHDNEMSIGGILVYDSYNNDVQNNTINGEDLVYHENEDGVTINDGGQIVLVNCSNITIENVNISQCAVAIEVFDSRDILIESINTSYCGCGIASIKSDDVAVKNSTFSRLVGFGILSLAGGNTTIEGNTISQTSVGAAIIDVKGINIELYENGLSIQIEFNNGTNVIRNNIMDELYLLGVVVISLADNDVRDNSFKLDQEYLPFAGIVALSINHAEINIDLNSSIHLNIEFGSGKQTFSNNSIENSSMGMLIVSDSLVEISACRFINTYIMGIVILSIDSVSVNIHFAGDANINGEISIVFSRSDISILNFTAEMENETFGIVIISNSKLTIQDSTLNGIERSAAGIVDISLNSIEVDLQTKIENQSFDQTVEVEISGGSNEHKIVNNTILNFFEGIFILSGDNINVERNTITNINQFGILDVSLHMLCCRYSLSGYIETSEDVEISMSVSMNIKTEKDLHIISGNNIAGTWHNVTAQLGIASISGNFAVTNNTLSSESFIGIFLPSVDEIYAVIDILSENVTADITFSHLSNGYRIQSNRVYNTGIGILTISDGFSVISDNKVYDAKAVGISYAGLQSIYYEHSHINSTYRDNITVYESNNGSTIENNEIENVGFSLGNLSSGVLIAGGSNVTVEGNNIFNLSSNMPPDAYIHINGILVVNPNVAIRSVHNSTDHEINITIFSQNGNHRIRNNIIKDGQACGISLWYSSGNEIYQNRIENVSIGVFIPSNPVPEMNISVSPGVGSNNNMIYHNNFVNNSIQAIDCYANTWNLTYPHGGNYWSDYSGRDIYRGVNQDIPGKDRIGDTPYVIPSYDDRDDNSHGDRKRNPREIIVHISTVDNEVDHTSPENSDRNADFYPLMFEYGSIPPVARFSYTPSDPYYGDIINFVDESSDIDGYIVTWSWDFGDGNTSNEQNPSHAYSKPGAYMVRLTVMDDSGLIDTLSINVTVGGEEDDVKPSIYDIAIRPEAQAQGEPVNISCNVEDDVAVQEVRINISYPDGSYQNLSMNKLGSNEYYLNQSYDLLGTYSFIIWAVDTSNNSNVSSEHNFEIIDVTPPTIVDNTPSSATTGDTFTFNATVTNTAEISSVYVEYWYGNGTHLNESMNNIAGNWWIKEIIIADTLQSLHYIISAVDSYGNWNRTLEKEVEITDNDKPIISDISIAPDVQDVGEYVNISCIVQDNIEVSDVWINLTDPLGHSVEIKMSKIGDMYYINGTYSILGNYNFTIFANDTSGNLAQSSVFTFRIVKVNMSVKLKKPVEKGLYFNDRYLKLFRPKMTIIIGKITLSAEIEDGIGNVTVYFYINDELKAKIENPPYTWTFNERMFGRKCTIRVVAEDEYGHTAEYSVQARIFNLGIFSK